MSASPSQSQSSDAYPVFPNGRFISKFYLVSSDQSGLTQTDKELFNRCYLPSRPLKNRSSVEKSDYQIAEAPCKRQAAINANCYFTWNGTVASIEKQTDAEEERRCFCEVYPFFETVGGCQGCFERHGGVEGYHWFPESYLSAASATYCAASSLTTGFYPFVSSWAETASVAMQVPSTTARDVLGTNTAVSGYFTATATAGSTSTKTSMGISAVELGIGQLLFPVLLALLFVR